MVAGLWLAVWERRTNWQGRGLRRGGLWDWEGESLIFILLVGTLLNGYQDRGKRAAERQKKAWSSDCCPICTHTHTHIHVEEEFSHTWTRKDTHTLTYQRGRTKCLYSLGVKLNNTVMVCLYEKKHVIYMCLIYSAHIQTHTCAHAWTHTHKQPTQPFSWYGLPLSMQITFIMQMHTNQNQPSENPSWGKTKRIKLNEWGEKKKKEETCWEVCVGKVQCHFKVQKHM